MDKIVTARLSPEQARTLRLRSQRLTGAERRVTASIPEILKDLCGVQAQDARAASLALRARDQGFTADDVEGARLGERSIARTWCMRGTLHLMASADLGWLLPLLGPLFIRQSRRRYAQLDLDEPKSIGAIRAIRALLEANGPMIRAELLNQLAEQGISAEGQAIYHLIRRAGLQGVLCYGPNRDGEPTFRLLEEGVDQHALPEEAALAQIGRRYLAAYGPAGPEDLATWSGLSVRQARAAFDAIGGELLEVEIGGQPAWLPRNRADWLDEPVDAALTVRLLPAFDAYLLGYRGRDLDVPEPYARRIHPGGGIIRPVLLVNGQAAGTWKLKRRKKSVAIIIEPFESLSADVVEAVHDEVQDIGRYLETDATWND